MKQAVHTLAVSTRRKGLVDITSPVAEWLSAQDIGTGLLTLWCRHTSASLTVQENASPEVRADIHQFFETLVPEDGRRYAHRDEGADDMPAHLRTMLTATQLTVPIVAGVMALGTWQAIYLFEHRRAPHRREVTLHLIGEGA